MFGKDRLTPCARRPYILLEGAQLTPNLLNQIAASAARRRSLCGVARGHFMAISVDARHCRSGHVLK